MKLNLLEYGDLHYDEDDDLKSYWNLQPEIIEWLTNFSLPYVISFTFTFCRPGLIIDDIILEFENVNEEILFKLTWL